MRIQHFFDPDTSTLTYLVVNDGTKDAVVVDPVLNFDLTTERLKDSGKNEVLEHLQLNDLNLRAILETHAHADHISGAQVLKKWYPNAVLGISEDIRVVQEVFKAKLNLTGMATDGSQFDRLFRDNEEVEFGGLRLRTVATPGHTPACMTYLFGDNAFVGDALFMPDSGTGRCDFPRGCARTLYRSVRKLFDLPDETRLFVGHDYSPGGRELRFQTTVGDSKTGNIHLRADTSEDDFVSFRTARDRTLSPPRKLEASIRANVMAGRLQ